jgi:hypothetical protein
MSRQCGAGLPVPHRGRIAAPGLDHEVVAAGHGQPLAGRQDMVLEVAAAGHPQRAFAGHHPGWARGQPALHIAHQYLFHARLLFLPNL